MRTPRRMTENPGTRTGLNVGDRVKVHADATSEFVIVSIDGEDAAIESVRDDVPGRFPLPYAPRPVGPGRVLSR